MPKLRRLGPGSWFVPGQNTLHIARAFYLGTDGSDYLDGWFIPDPPRPGVAIVCASQPLSVGLAREISR